MTKTLPACHRNLVSASSSFTLRTTDWECNTANGMDKHYTALM